MEKILKLLKQNARLSNDQLAAMLDTTAEDVAGQIASLEARGIIKGYKPIIDYEKIDSEIVTAIIELKVTPQKDFGFEEIAKRIVEYNEVDSVYLMSGGYDLSVTVKGKTFKDIALFVAIGWRRWIPLFLRQPILSCPVIKIPVLYYAMLLLTKGGIIGCDGL